MDCYNDFASVYDRLTTDINYKEFVSYVEKILLKHGKKPHLILELACGTGNMTKEFNLKGYDVIGVDKSKDMLSVAKEKCPDNLLLNQDMTSFELYGTVDAVVCLLDSVNYVTNDNDLLKMFKLVNNYLEYDGLFIFDINSEHKLLNIIGNNTFVYDSEEIFYTWENEVIKDKVEFYLNFFIQENGKYQRIEEIHTEKVYKLDKLIKIIEKSGLEYVASYADFDLSSPTEMSERIFLVSRKKTLT